MPNVEFECEHCQQSVEAPLDMIGEIADCPHCQKSIVIPESAVIVKEPLPPAPPPPAPKTRQCPFCAEEIQRSALKCKHCGEFLDGRKKEQQPEKVVVKEKGHSGCGLILIIALGIVVAIALMSMF